LIRVSSFNIASSTHRVHGYPHKMPEAKPPAPAVATLPQQVTVPSLTLPEAPLPVKTLQQLPAPCLGPSELFPASRTLEPPDWLNSAWTWELHWTWTREPDIFAELKQQLNERLQGVETMSENQSSAEAIILYAKILNDHLDSCAEPRSPAEGFIVQTTIRAILCSCCRRYPQIEVAVKVAKKTVEDQNKQRHWLSEEKFSPVGFSVLEILKRIDPSDTSELSLAFHILARSLVKFTKAYAAAETLYRRAIEQIGLSLGTDASQAESVRQDLAQLYIEHFFDENQRQAFDPIQSWAQQEQLIESVLDGMERNLGENHQRVFKYLHGLGNRYLDVGMEDDGEMVFKEV
jgi:hypothetical protein